MALRKQSSRSGKGTGWTYEQIEAGMRHFYAKNGHHPTAHEIDDYPYLPSSRSIERAFGGLVALRKRMGLTEDELDLRAGSHSTRRAYSINERAHKVEATVYEHLVKLFGRELVHREYFFPDDRRTRADFFVYDAHGGFCVDVFYPKDLRNLTGCVNSKRVKYCDAVMLQYPVILLQMNKAVEQPELDRMVSKKKKPLPKNTSLMTWGTFTSFCARRKRLNIARKGIPFLKEGVR